MATYLLRRFLIGLLTLFLITFLIYGLIRAMPGSPITLMNEDPSRALKQEDIDRMKAFFGLDQPWYVAYWSWLTKVAQFDLGTSISQKQPVATLIRGRLWPTLLLSISSLLLTYLLSIPLGLVATVRSGRWDERVTSTLLYTLYSFPAFVAALLLQMYLAVRLDWFPLFGMQSDQYAELSTWGKFQDLAWHAALPITCYTYGSLAYYSRFIRSNMHEVIRQDYIRTARAKGVGPVRVVLHHAFRNTLIPLVTLIGLTLPGLLSGSIILEQIFGWPGMGRLFFEAILMRDYPTIMAETLIFAVLTLAGQMLADVLYAAVDPRVSFS
ncbi:MAG: ABC transporter permease [Pirellulales bacterium]|nr:ABC transporter permease [Pirellulales bacterium]